MFTHTGCVIAMKDLQGKVAVVTGGASGIGLGLARALVNEGCNVVLADMKADTAEARAKELSAESVEVVSQECDVTQPASVTRLADFAWERFGQVDLVFCNAGVMPPPGPFVAAKQEEARWVFEVNYFGVWNTAQEFSRRLLAQGSPAHLTITGSENSICVPAPLVAAYNSSKHAVLGLAEVIRGEMPEFIGVSILCPGIVKTALSSSIETRPDEYGGAQKDPFGGELPLGMDPDDIGRRAIEQVKAGSFYIMTHHCNRYMVVERYEEQLAALDAQTRPDDGSDELDTRKIMREIAS